MARRYSTSQGSEKENRPETEIRRYNMSYPDEGRKRSGHGAANVQTPLFNRLPDPLQSPTVVQSHFHELDSARADFPDSSGRLDIPPPRPLRRGYSLRGFLKARQIPKQRSAIGIALSPTVDGSANGTPSGLTEIADKIGIHREGHGDSQIWKAPHHHAGDPQLAARDSTASKGSAGYSDESGWKEPGSVSLDKPHAVLGITVALTKVNSNADSKYSSGSSPYLSSQIKMNPRVQTYRDGGDAPRSKIPSCSGLPVGWDEANDRCIAYLSTHAPLTRSGKIPANEATIERYSLQQISEFLMARFPKFRNLKKIPIWAIERRLQMLDLNENEYFRVPYGGYRYEEWGRDI